MGKSYRQQFEEAMKCRTKKEAARWLGREVKRYVKEFQKAPEDAEGIIKSNLGYMAGYYDDATAQKVHSLFGAVHPIFGTADYFTKVSPKAAFDTGKTLGRIAKP